MSNRKFCLLWWRYLVFGLSCCTFRKSMDKILFFFIFQKLKCHHITDSMTKVTIYPFLFVWITYKHRRYIIIIYSFYLTNWVRLLCGLACAWHANIMKSIYDACIILHNMIVNDERHTYVDNFDYNNICNGISTIKAMLSNSDQSSTRSRY